MTGRGRYVPGADETQAVCCLSRSLAWLLPDLDLGIFHHAATALSDERQQHMAWANSHAGPCLCSLSPMLSACPSPRACAGGQEEHDPHHMRSWPQEELVGRDPFSKKGVLGPGMILLELTPLWTNHCSSPHLYPYTCYIYPLYIYIYHSNSPSNIYNIYNIHITLTLIYIFLCFIYIQTLEIAFSELLRSNTASLVGALGYFAAENTEA